jgi:hypothetical protein
VSEKAENEAAKPEDPAKQEGSTKPEGPPKPEPPKSDWVTKRFLCSLPNVFKDLMLQVEEDIKTRNALRPNNSPYEFSVTESGPEFTVALEAEGVHKSVIFTLEEHAFLVRDDKGKKMFEVTLSFSEQGECKLHVNQEERELWQLRRMALEDLLFHGY